MQKKQRNIFLLNYARKEKKLLMQGAGFTLLAVVFDLIAPNIISHILDVELKDIRLPFHSNNLFCYLGIYFLVSLTASLFRYASTFYLEVTSNKIVKNIREDLYKHVQKLPIRFFDKYPAGKIVSKITNDTEAVKNLYMVIVREFTIGILYLLGIYAALFYQNPIFGFMALCLFPIVIFLIYFYARYSSRYNHNYRQKLSELNALINESIQGISIIRTFVHEEKSEQEYREISRGWSEQLKKITFLDSVMSYNVSELLRNLTFSFVIFFFGRKSIESNSGISIGLIYVFVDYLSKIFIQIQNIMNKLNDTERSLVAAENVLEFLNEEEIQDMDFDEKEQKPLAKRKNECFQNKEENPFSDGNVSFQNIVFAYDTEIVLKNITFDVKKGETVAFVGHTGSGKSSVINLLLGFYQPLSGEILYDGRAYPSNSIKTIRQNIAVVLQDVYLFTGTIFSNIALGNSKITEKIAEKALIEVGGEAFLSRLKDGLRTPVYEKGNSFSSGERQLISFARALVRNPKILVLDEATSNIDTETELIIQKAMAVLSKKRTTFVVAHRLSTIKNADKIIVLDNGEMIEQGTHEQLMANKGKYYYMYMTQMKEIQE